MAGTEASRGGNPSRRINCRFSMRREGIPLSACQILDIRHDERGKLSRRVECLISDTTRGENPRRVDCLIFHTPRGYPNSTLTRREGVLPLPVVSFSNVSGWSTPSRHVHFSYVDMSGWFRPPRHVRFFIFNMSGWFRPRGDVHLVFPEVSGWFIPFRHLHSLFADVSGWFRPPRHIHFVLLDVINL